MDAYKKNHPHPPTPLWGVNTQLILEEEGWTANTNSLQHAGF